MASRLTLYHSTRILKSPEVCDCYIYLKITLEDVPCYHEKANRFICSALRLYGMVEATKNRELANGAGS